MQRRCRILLLLRCHILLWRRCLRILLRRSNMSLLRRRRRVLRDGRHGRQRARRRPNDEELKRATLQAQLLALQRYDRLLLVVDVLAGIAIAMGGRTDDGHATRCPHERLRARPGRRRDDLPRGLRMRAEDKELKVVHPKLLAVARDDRFVLIRNVLADIAFRNHRADDEHALRRLHRSCWRHKAVHAGQDRMQSCLRIAGTALPRVQGGRHGWKCRRWWHHRWLRSVERRIERGCVVVRHHSYQY